MNQKETKTIDKILFILESDPKTGHIGVAEQLVILTKRVDSIEDNQAKIQDRNKMLYRISVGIGGVLTFVIGKSWGAIMKIIL